MKTLKAIVTKENGSKFAKKAVIKIDSESAIESGKKLLIAAWVDSLNKEYNLKDEDLMNISFFNKESKEIIENTKKIESIINNIEFLIINE